MTQDAPAYGLWLLVAANSVIFIMFAFSFGKPQSPRDWRSFGMFRGFIGALFAEMYGFPLSIYLMSGWLQTKYPSLDLMSHDEGHLWSTMFGLTGNPHLSVLHIISFVFIGGGFMYVHLAHTEEAEARKTFDEGYDRYGAQVPGWFPRLRRPRTDRGLV